MKGATSQARPSFAQLGQFWFLSLKYFLLIWLFQQSPIGCGSVFLKQPGTSTPSRNIPDRADAAKEGPRCRAYRWSSGTRPRTKSSVGASYCEALSPPSAIPGDDKQHTASVSAQLIREHFGSRTAGTQNRPAIGRQPSMTGTRLRSRTVTEIRAGSSEMTVEPRRYTTACVLLKQPDKQKVVSRVGLWR